VYEAMKNGVWMRKGSPVAFVSIHTKGNETIFRRSSMGNHPNHFKISRVYYRHASSPDFQRIITTAYGMYIMYQWTYMCTLKPVECDSTVRISLIRRTLDESQCTVDCLCMSSYIAFCIHCADVKTESRRWLSFSMHLIEMNTPLN